MKKKTIGIIGPGNHFEEKIYPLFKKYNFLKIGGVFRKRNKKFKNINNMSEDIFFKKNFDFIYIACPSVLHEKYIIKSLQNNSHVICEKPFIASSNKINSIISLAKKKKKLLFETFMYQYHPSFHYVEKLMKKKTYGKFKYLISSFRCPSVAKKNNRYKKKAGGGFFLDTASYLVSLENALFTKKLKKNEIVSQKIKQKVDLKGNIFINSDNKKRFYFWGEGQNYSNNLEIFFENATFYINKFFSKKNNEQIYVKMFYKGSVKIMKLKRINHFKSMFDLVFKKYLHFNFQRINYLKIKNQVNLMKNLNR